MRQIKDDKIALQLLEIGLFSDPQRQVAAHEVIRCRRHPFKHQFGYGRLDQGHPQDTVPHLLRW